MQPPPRRTVVGWAVAVVAWIVAVLFFRWQTGIWTPANLDVGVYRDAATDLLAGGDVYQGKYGATGLPFTYPPFGLLVLIPFALISAPAAVAVVFATGAVALVVCVRLSAAYARPGHVTPWWAATAGSAACAVVLEPVRVTLGLGQVNLLILLAILGLDAGSRERLRGLGAGLGAAVKITPALLVAAQAVRGDWRAFGRGVAAFAVATAVAAVVLPGPTAQYFGGLLWQSDRPGVLGYPGNQSLRGLVERVAPGQAALWLLGALIVLVLGVIAVRRQRRDPWLSLTAAAVTGLLVSPVSWTHHWVWVLPVAAVSWRWRRELPVLAWSGAALVAATALLTGPAVGLDYSWLAALWVFAGENAYVLAALFWLAAAAWRGPTEPVAGQPANPVLSAG